MTWREKSLAAGVISALLMFNAGCGGSDSNTPGSGGTGAGQCHAADKFQPGVSKTGPNGMTVTLTEASPATPTIPDNMWMISVKDRSGAPVDGASIGVQRVMPAHDGHSTPRVPVVSAQGNGVYKLDPVNFNMEGPWRIDISVTTAAASDDVQFEFCVS